MQTLRKVLQENPLGKMMVKLKAFKYHDQQFNCILITLLDVYCNVGQVYGLAYFKKVLGIHHTTNLTLRINLKFSINILDKYQ
jgi:hypothetical protein